MVPVVCCPTRAGPDAITQGDVTVHMAADGTELGRGKPRLDVVYHCTRLGRDMVQGLHKRAKAQIRHFTTPEGFHALKIERFQGNVVVLRTQCMRQIPVKRLSEMGDTAMHPRQMVLGLAAVLRTLDFARELPIGTPHVIEILTKEQGRLYLCLIRAFQEQFQ